MRNNISISVITVCFNAAETIENTIRSVLSQTYPFIEYIIVDGASTDGTMEIVNKYSPKISKVVSEKDKGIYDAMNKGIALSTGDVINFLNADDYFYDDKVAENAVNALISDSSRTLVYGKVELFDVPADITPRRNFSVKSINDFQDHTICHQTAFVRRELFFQIGKFNEEYKYASDLDWMIKAYKYRPKGFYELDKKFVYFSWKGRTVQNYSASNKEASFIRLWHFFSLKNVWHYFRYIILRGMKKKILNEEQ